jgi:hypothetical protein
MYHVLRLRPTTLAQVNRPGNSFSQCLRSLSKYNFSFEV